MKKDDKQPDKSKKKPQKKAAELNLVARPKYVLDLDAKKYKNSLTLGQWKELREKNPSLLTPQQMKQLEEANKMAAEFAVRLTEQYDFPGLFKSIQTIPFTKIAEDVRSMALATDAIRANLIIPAQQLANFQQSLIVTSDLINHALIDAFKAANIARSLLAGFEGFNTRLIKALRVDIPSLGVGLARFSETEIIDLSVTSVSERNERVVISSDTTRTYKVGDFELVSSSKIDFILTEMKANRSELAELKGLISKGSQSGLSRIEFADVDLRREASKLVIKGFEIVVTASSKQSMFCDIFFSSASNFAKKWDIEDFILEAFGERFSKTNPEKYWLGIVRSYVFQLNRNILGATQGQFSDFFVVLGSEVYINPKYLSNL